MPQNECKECRRFKECEMFGYPPACDILWGLMSKTLLNKQGQYKK